MFQQFCFCWFQEEARADSYRYAVPTGKDGAANKAPPKAKGKKKKAAELDNLKQEMEMDEHKITVEELAARYGCNPVRVSVCCIAIVRTPTTLDISKTNALTTLNATYKTRTAK